MHLAAPEGGLGTAGRGLPERVGATDGLESEAPSGADVRQALALLQDEQRTVQAMQVALGDASHRVGSEPESRPMPGHGPA